MKTLKYFLVGVLLLTACVEKLDTTAPEQNDSEKWEAEFGKVDPNQTWNMATKANLSISARYAGTIEIFTQNPIIEGSMLLMRKQVEAGTHDLQFDVPQGTEKVFVQLSNQYGSYVSGYLPLDGTAAAANAAYAPATRADGCPVTVKPETLDVTVKNKHTGDEITTPFYVLKDVETIPNGTFWELIGFAGGQVLDWIKGNVNQLGQDVVYTFAEDGSLEMNLLCTNSKNTNKFGIIILDENGSRENSRKYIVADISSKDIIGFFYSNTYKIPYVDADGNTSYTFPKGTKIAFFNWATNGKGNGNGNGKEMPKIGHVNYSKLAWNQEVGFTPEGSNDAYRGVATFRYGNNIYISFEDDFEDCYIDDFLFTINGNFEEQAPQLGPETKPMTWTLAFEDQIGAQSDYDFNDVVIRVAHVAGEKTAKVTYCAAGGTFQTELFFNETSLGDIHDKFEDFDHKSLINTYSIDKKYVTETLTVPENFSLSNDAPRFKIKVTLWDGNVKESKLPTAAEYGSTPQGFCVPGNWAWPREGMNIKDAYSQFEEWTKDANVNQDWYKTEVNASAVVTEPESAGANK